MGLSRRHPRLLQRANFLQVWIAEAALNSSFDPLFTGRFLANNRPGSPRRAQGGRYQSFEASKCRRRSSHSIQISGTATVALDVTYRLLFPLAQGVCNE